jgi:hypothetical protein
MESEPIVNLKTSSTIQEQLCICVDNKFQFHSFNEESTTSHTIYRSGNNNMQQLWWNEQISPIVQIQKQIHDIQQFNQIAQ